MTARLIRIALSVVFIHERYCASLGEEMPRGARRDMFASGKRDIQKCDMFARLTRYALRARKASSDTVASLGERNAAPYINKNIKKFLKEGTGEKFF